MRVLAVAALAAALVMSACATTPGARNAAVIASVASGAGDPCTGEGWARAGLLRDDAALVSLKQAVGRRLDQEQGDVALPEDAVRLAGLENSLRALMDMPSPAQWASLRAGAARWVGDVQARATAVHGDDFRAARARLDLFVDAAQRNQSYSDESLVGASLRSCLLSPLHRRARLAYGAAFVETLATRGWPQDAKDGDGAAFVALDLMPQFFTVVDRDAACVRLKRASENGPLDRGAWAYVRMALRCSIDWGATPDAFVAQLLSEWPALARFFASLPRRSTGEDLRLRVALEQYGRHLVFEEFPSRFGYPQLTDAREAAMLALIAAADADNTAHLKQLLVGRTWLDDQADGVGAEQFAFLIVQHADADRAFQAEMLQRLEPLAEAGRAPRYSYGMLWDRVAVAQGRPQRFATQVTCQNGEVIAAGGVEDAAALDTRRAAFDFLQTWDEYRDMMRVLIGCRPS